MLFLVSYLHLKTNFSPGEVYFAAYHYTASFHAEWLGYRQDYQHLVYSAFPNNHQEFVTLPPAIIKPGHWWTGKQVR